MGKRVIYIAGPITGVPNYWEPFEQAEDALTAKGFIALSPARLPEGMQPEQYMQICMAMLAAADAALFLEDWPKSLGASLEHAYCCYCDKKRLYVVDGQLPDLKEV